MALYDTRLFLARVGNSKSLKEVRQRNKITSVLGKKTYALNNFINDKLISDQRLQY